MNLRRKKIGARGENLAVSYLKRRGYRIIERNYRCRHGEVDAIARDGDTLVFVEVKTRSEGSFGTPLDAVSPAKRNKLVMLANWYLLSQKIQDVPVRFDVVAVDVSGTEPSITVVRNAFDSSG